MAESASPWPSNDDVRRWLDQIAPAVRAYQARHGEEQRKTLEVAAHAARLHNDRMLTQQDAMRRAVEQIARLQPQQPVVSPEAVRRIGQAARAASRALAQASTSEPPPATVDEEEPSSPTTEVDVSQVVVLSAEDEVPFGQWLLLLRGLGRFGAHFVDPEGGRWFLMRTDSEPDVQDRPE